MPRRDRRGFSILGEDVVGVFPIVVEGDLRQLPPPSPDDERRPWLALWVDARSSLALAFRLIDVEQSPDAGVSESLDTLELALRDARIGAPLAASPLTPVLVRTSAALAAAIRPRLSGQVRVEAVEDLPVFDEVFAEMAPGLAPAPLGTPEPYAWEVDRALLKRLCKAALEFARRQPWTYLADDPPLEVVLGAASPLDGLEVLYGSVHGADGELCGIVYYRSLDDYRAARDAGILPEPGDEPGVRGAPWARTISAPLDPAPAPASWDLIAGSLPALSHGSSPAVAAASGDALTCLLIPYEEADPEYLTWLEERGIPIDPEGPVPRFHIVGQGHPSRPPDEREARALLLALSATGQFLIKHRYPLRRVALPDGGLHHTAQVGSKASGLEVAVHLPPAGYEGLGGQPWPGDWGRE